ncbi:MAG: hypothetical protein LBL00_08785 [Endomicrobium sp.]|jgi:hypothetical protein|nr:hypothetical protein [Endomicrobium sp.]
MEKDRMEGTNTNSNMCKRRARAIISQPMRGKSEKQIRSERAEVVEMLQTRGYDVVDTIFPEFPQGCNVPLKFLAKSLEYIAGVELVVFMPGWNDARGCKIEHAACLAYGIRVEYALPNDDGFDFSDACVTRNDKLIELSDSLSEHKYTRVCWIDNPDKVPERFCIIAKNSPKIILEMKFQNGEIKEGINGIMDENLLAIVRERLLMFNSGKFVCRENSLAITCIEEALMWLKKRTADREKRGVEGMYEI